jgi:hypothetical protein
LAFVSLVDLSLGTTLTELLKQPLKIRQIKEKSRFAYNFYQELLNLYKVSELSEFDVSKRESESFETINLFPFQAKYTK